MDFASAHAASVITERQLQERQREQELRRQVLERAATDHTTALAPPLASRSACVWRGCCRFIRRTEAPPSQRAGREGVAGVWAAVSTSFEPPLTLGARAVRPGVGIDPALRRGLDTVVSHRCRGAQSIRHLVRGDRLEERRPVRVLRLARLPRPSCPHSSRPATRVERCPRSRPSRAGRARPSCPSGSGCDGPTRARRHTTGPAGRRSTRTSCATRRRTRYRGRRSDLVGSRTGRPPSSRRHIPCRSDR